MLFACLVILNGFEVNIVKVMNTLQVSPEIGVPCKGLSAPVDRAYKWLVSGVCSQVNDECRSGHRSAYLVAALPLANEGALEADMRVEQMLGELFGRLKRLVLASGPITPKKGSHQVKQVIGSGFQETISHVL